MGDMEAAAQFVAPAYALTFAAFAALAFFTVRRLRAWSKRAQEEGASEESEET
jgi:hypothetical protein